jgi:hypothetical protein
VKISCGSVYAAEFPAKEIAFVLPLFFCILPKHTNQEYTQHGETTYNWRSTAGAGHGRSGAAS